VLQSGGDHHRPWERGSVPFGTIDKYNGAVWRNYIHLADHCPEQFHLFDAHFPSLRGQLVTALRQVGFKRLKRQAGMFGSGFGLCDVE
jgi:hypothetical protein